MTSILLAGANAKVTVKDDSFEPAKRTFDSLTPKKE